MNWTLLLALLAGHFVADYPLQGDFLARGKNHRAQYALYGVPWWHCLTAHAAIHAGMVGWLTGSVALGLAEFVAHWLIDFAKCEGWTDINVDQLAHVVCKVAFVGYLASRVVA